jgi:hypothetical protein
MGFVKSIFKKDIVGKSLEPTPRISMPISITVSKINQSYTEPIYSCQTTFRATDRIHRDTTSTIILYATLSKVIGLQAPIMSLEAFFGMILIGP